MRRLLVLKVALALSVVGSAALAAGCTAEAKQEPAPLTVTRSDTRDKNLLKSVVPIKAAPDVGNGYVASLVGATFSKSTGDVFKDIQVVGMGLSKQDFDDAVQRGMDFGFKNGVDKETEKKDAYLTLYMKYRLTGAGGQRDSVIPATDISAVDDQGAKLDLIHVSNKDKYIDGNYPYGVLIFKTFNDAKSVRLDLNGTTYLINVDQLKKR